MNEFDQIKERLVMPSGKIRVVIDSDAYNEVDDQFAIAWALKSNERMTVEAVYAVPFSHDCFSNANKEDRGDVKSALKTMVHAAASAEEGMKKSYDEILNIYDLLEIDSAGKV